jgi:hypothetical protein
LINEALERLAISLAMVLDDVRLRRFIKREVGRKFDGDYEMLYKFVRSYRFSDGESFEDKLIEGYRRMRLRNGVRVGRLRARGIVSSLISRILSIPVNFERWNAENYIPLVAYHPVGVDDKEVKKIKAFDVDGNEYWLDARETPDFPVIVLGINERVNDEGRVRYRGIPQMQLLDDGIDDGGGGGGSGGSGSNNNLPPRQWGAREILEKLQVLDDQEPWTKGDPEIVLQIRAKNKPSGPFLFEANNFGWDGAGTPWGDDYTGWRTYNWEMFDWLQENGEWVVFYWYEDDWDWSLGIKTTVTIKIFGIPFQFKVNLTIGDSDDVYGEKMVYLTDSYQEYNIRDMIKWYLKWRNPTSS